MSFNIWTNIPLQPSQIARLQSAVGQNKILISPDVKNILKSAGPDPLLADAEIAFGQPDPDQLLSLTRLKWLHLSTAGYTRYDRPDLRDSLTRRGVLVTNSSSVFAEPCAEHLLAFMLASARNLPAAFANQFGPHDWPQDEMRKHSHLLTGQSALILSFGSIAKRLVELLRPFRMSLRAVRRNPSPGEPIPICPMSDLDKLLPEADHIINILPAHESTNQIINNQKFTLMKPGAIFYNIGRGSTIDQPSLIRALETRRLAAAYLDVTDPEPLPPTHPLWTAPNCHITPHTAGGHLEEFNRTLDHFLENLQLFQSNSPLKDRIF